MRHILRKSLNKHFVQLFSRQHTPGAIVIITLIAAEKEKDKQQD